MVNRLATFGAIVLRDLLGLTCRHGTAEEHLAAAEAWIRRAHDHGPDDGVSYGYSAIGGWRPSYRETSGYIATTFFDLAKVRENSDWFERAIRIVEWLIDVQNADGSISNPKFGPEGIVFDTGQVLLGLIRAFEETQQTEFLDAASRAGDWLIRVADNDGRWTRNEYLNTPHVYNTRSAWAVLRLNNARFSEVRLQVARANLDWALAEQQRSGFFAHCAFEPRVAPFTHTIAYTTRGLLECGMLLNDPSYLEGAIRCADATLGCLGADGFLPGRITPDGERDDSFCCMTGNCQFAIVWAKLFRLTGAERYQTATIRALDFVMRSQDIHCRSRDINGAIRGSQPMWGSYSPFTFPNWATKFFIDAMLLRAQWNR
jgi:uncharacterized protein YyaL (SSP411 family)